MSAVWAVAIKELRQIRRDRRTVLILLFVPTFFLFLYAMRSISTCVTSRLRSTIGTGRPTAGA